MSQTRYWADILQQPAELRGILHRLMTDGRGALGKAANLVAGAETAYVTGIGSSWHAGLAIRTLFAQRGRPVHLADASELLYFAELKQGAPIVLLSRSGRSVEVVRLLDKARSAGCPIIAITNAPDSPLAAAADVVLDMAARLDHNVSVSMYSGLALVGGVLAEVVTGGMDVYLGMALVKALENAERLVPRWREQLEASDWLDPRRTAILLARGASLASASEARLLWEEAGKAQAVALTTGGFRHGPQEAVHREARVALWLDARTLREHDLRLAADLRREGARVAIIGQDIPAEGADVVLSLPEAPPAWQFLVDVMPMQVAADVLAARHGVDCDAFKYCAYVVDTEGGL